ncbi:hypothetical protein DFAR_1520004 [Desulfarculales bacterium]
MGRPRDPSLCLEDAITDFPQLFSPLRLGPP